MKVITDENRIKELLERGVEDVFVKEDLYNKLKSGKELRVKLGIDPTGSKIHIGRAVILRKLRAFQDLGHKAVLIIGDFTAQIGDPSDKLQKRPMLGKEEIAKNLENYKEQLGKIVDLDKTEFVYNGSWLGKLGFGEISLLAESFSIQQMLARRNFKERYEKGEEISLREFMYPLMQGYDSVAVRADVELGGFDQLFNLKAGRIIQKHYGQPEQDVLTVKMLEGTDGRKMSTSWGNVINIVDDPADMYGKIMSVKDELIGKYFLLATDVPRKEIEEIEEGIRSGGNPKDAKMRLGREIVSLYHGKEAAVAAENSFVKAFAKGGVPDEIPEVEASEGALLSDALMGGGIISSKTEFRRLIEEGAITHQESGEKISDAKAVVSEGVYKVGKKRFVRIKIK